MNSKVFSSVNVLGFVVRVNQAHGAVQPPCLSEPPHAGRIFICSAGMGLPGLPWWQQEKLLAFLNRDKNIYFGLGFAKSQSRGFVVILTNNRTGCSIFYNSNYSSCLSSFLDFISVSLFPLKRKDGGGGVMWEKD